ncbi:MAG: hypothetical protein KDM64_16255, partial [Verrucomicrobiae bacterium]|nr:hypothetical protein [Verrucomicrobiae bacterium]
MNILRPTCIGLSMAFLLTLLTGCVDPPAGSESQIWQRPPRYGHGGTEDTPKLPGSNKPKPAATNNAGTGRFGFTGNDSNKPEENPADSSATGSTPPTERGRDTAATEKPADPTPPKEEKKPSGPPSVSEMPFAKGVPG